MKLCSHCREPRDRAGQRYCLKCQATYMRQYRERAKVEHCWHCDYGNAAGYLRCMACARPPVREKPVCGKRSPSRRETPFAREGS